MSFFTRLSTSVCFGRRSRVRLTARQWNDLIAELGRRAGGVREAGAFLLTAGEERAAKVRRFVYFDDVDPTCLTGGISMRSSAFGALWDICAAERMRVVADVHTHPGVFVDQSDIDRANPMIATAGHIAVIVPDLARRAIAPSECGVHIYRGAHTWDSMFGSDAARLLYVGRLA